MHTFTHDEPKKLGDAYDRRTVFNFDGDFCGDVLIRVDGEEISVPFHALKEFIALYVRRKKIEHIENEFTDRLLGLE